MHRERHLGLDDYILRFLGRTPQKTTQIHQTLQGEYGSIHLRVVYIHLQKLLATRLIRVAYSEPNRTRFYVVSPTK